MNEIINEEKKNMTLICNKVRVLVNNDEYEESKNLLKSMIGEYPHAPEPHNLFGLILEKEGDHLLAMKHFRAAWALDPTYLPARYNLENFGTFVPKGRGAFDESDCPPLIEKAENQVEYDNNGLGHLEGKLCL
nr:hypothetical protein [uncultured Clostridium sp.]